MRFWMATAYCEPDQLTHLARTAEDAGYHGVMVSDHIAYPETLSSPYPYTSDGRPPFEPDTPWPDAWVAIGAMAAVTERLHFSTNIYVAAARNPFAVAKSIATVAAMSGNRVALGAGAGWMREEFDLMGQPFRDRGRRLDEMLEVLRMLFGGGWVEHHGEFYDFDRLRVSPVPTEPVPFWIGGESDAAIARAARNDGWIGGVYPPDTAFEWIDRVHAALLAAGREPGDGFELILAVYALDDLDLFRRLEDAGVTALVTAPWMLADSDLDARRRAIAEFGESVIQKLV